MLSAIHTPFSNNKFILINLTTFQLLQMRKPSFIQVANYLQQTVELSLNSAS